MRFFLSRAGDATKFEKIASPARAKNRSCGRGLSDRELSLLLIVGEPITFQTVHGYHDTSIDWILRDTKR